MEIFPAIDLRGGKAVRLVEGDYDRMTSYSDQPSQVAGGFREAGAKNLHVVDLDGAKDGQLSNFVTVREIVRTSGLSVQVGGGIRDEDRIQRYLDSGVNRVILGTAAIEHPEFLEAMLEKYKEKIAVGIDAKDRKIAIRGWMETVEEDSVEYCAKLAQKGVSTIIYTDISKDGMLQGTNLDVYRELAQKVSCRIIASGGVSFEQEITELKALGTYGAIVGKALYEGKLDLKKILEIAG